MLQTKADKVDAKSEYRSGERSAEAKKKIEDSIAPFGDYSDDSPGHPSDLSTFSRALSSTVR